MRLFVTSAFAWKFYSAIIHRRSIAPSTHWPAVSGHEFSLWFKFLETLVGATVLAPCKGIQDRLGFRILESGLDSTPWFRIPGTKFRILCQWNLDSGYQSLVGFRIPWAVFWILKPRIPNYTRKYFLHSGIRIPLHSFGWKFSFCTHIDASLFRTFKRRKHHV